MHSRIFQISKNPIPEDEYITDDKYFDNFVGAIADYVMQSTDEDKIIFQNIPGILYNAEENTITIENKHVYFADSYKNFKKQLQILSDITEEEFCQNHQTDLSYHMFLLNESYDDKYGIYIDDDYEEYGLMTLDDFIRHCKNGNTFYLGAVIDYHF